MGYAIAEAAVEAGHEVVLVSGPVSLAKPAGVEVIAVESARQMFEAVQKSLAGCDVAIFAAAVADYRPVSVSEQKIKKKGEKLVIDDFLFLQPGLDRVAAAMSNFIPRALPPRR